MKNLIKRIGRWIMDSLETVGKIYDRYPWYPLGGL